MIGRLVIAIVTMIPPAAVSAAAPAPGPIVHVDDGAPPGGDGLTWETAFRFLQDALRAAGPGAEIRVAQGTYLPDGDEAGRVQPGDRFASFTLDLDIALRGGYAGFGAPDPDARDVDAFETTLSGDLAGDDGNAFENNGENSYRVAIVPSTGDLGGTGNIGLDPLFEDPDAGDFRLRPGSPCIDAGDNGAVPEGIDTDLQDDPRFVDDPATDDTGQGDPPIVDMGASEFQGAPCPWDLDGDGIVSASDLLAVVEALGPCDGCPEDVTGNGVVNGQDVAAVATHFGPCP